MEDEYRLYIERVIPSRCLFFSLFYFFAMVWYQLFYNLSLQDGNFLQTHRISFNITFGTSTMCVLLLPLAVFIRKFDNRLETVATVVFGMIGCVVQLYRLIIVAKVASLPGDVLQWDREIGYIDQAAASSAFCVIFALVIFLTIRRSVCWFVIVVTMLLSLGSEVGKVVDGSLTAIAILFYKTGFYMLTWMAGLQIERGNRLLLYQYLKSQQRVEELERELQSDDPTASPFETVIMRLRECEKFVASLKNEPPPTNWRQQVHQLGMLLGQCTRILIHADDLFDVKGAHLQDAFARDFLFMCGGNRTFTKKDTTSGSSHAVIRAHSSLRLPNRLSLTRSTMRASFGSTTLLNLGIKWDFSVVHMNGDNRAIFFDVGRLLLLPLVTSPDIQCPPEVLRHFLKEAGANYRDVPYHNATHGAQVAHFVSCLMSFILPDQLSALDEVACIIAALIHDIGHPGFNNAFLMACRHPIAIAYNDNSVLENYHAALGFRIMQGENSNVLANVPTESYAAMRHRIIDLILVTDMKHHYNEISLFRAQRTGSDFDHINNADDSRKVLRMIMKGADLGHGALNWADHEVWSIRVVAEFYSQGEEESRLGWDVSPLCDRQKHNEIGKSQQGFINFVCLPLFQELLAVEGDSTELQVECISRLESNAERWQQSQDRFCSGLGELPSIPEVLLSRTDSSDILQNVFL
eukprot:GHVS01043992.1.p1 GENE.GHVS01043992.1~~GHVS01043992.1.p1  ORF type:complete len:692 (-),score=54.98 GHVS01043992.1:185-2260(-)